MDKNTSKKPLELAEELYKLCRRPFDSNNAKRMHEILAQIDFNDPELQARNIDVKCLARIGSAAQKETQVAQCLEWIKAFTARNAKVMRPTAEVTMLHTVADYCHAGVVKYLWEAGLIDASNINQLDYDGETALLRAMISGDNERGTTLIMARLLDSYGADPTVVVQGQKAIDFIRKIDLGQKELITYLEEMEHRWKARDQVATSLLALLQQKEQEKASKQTKEPPLPTSTMSMLSIQGSFVTEKNLNPAANETPTLRWRRKLTEPTPSQSQAEYSRRPN